MIDNSDARVAEAMTRLRNLIDPELGVNVVDLGLIHSAGMDAGVLRIAMTLTTPGCPLSSYMLQGAENLLAGLPGVDRAEVRLVWEPAWTPERMTPEGREQLGLRGSG